MTEEAALTSELAAELKKELKKREGVRVDRRSWIGILALFFGTVTGGVLVHHRRSRAAALVWMSSFSMFAVTQSEEAAFFADVNRAARLRVLLCRYGPELPARFAMDHDARSVFYGHWLSTHLLSPPEWEYFAALAPYFDGTVAECAQAARLVGAGADRDDRSPAHSQG